MSFGFLDMIFTRLSDDLVVRRDDGALTSVKSFRETAFYFAECAHDLGAKPGEPVAILLDRGPEFIAAVLGLMCANLIAVPFNPDCPFPEIEKMIDKVGIKKIIVKEVGELSTHLLKKDSRSRSLIFSDKKKRSPVRPGFFGARATKAGIIIHTSGSTSEPKSVFISPNLVDFQITELRKAWGLSETDCVLNVLPFDHLHGLLFGAILPIASGALIEVLNAFDAAEVWARISSGAVNVFMGTPTIYWRLVQHWRAQSLSERGRLSSAASKMRLMISGSDVLPAALLSEWIQLSGKPIVNRYAITELGVICSNRVDDEIALGTVGPPLPGVKIRIVSKNGKNLGQEVVGEIAVQGQATFPRYWRPGNISDSVDAKKGWANRWFRTGDLGKIDARGFLNVMGRASLDQFKSHGYLISAVEIESMLLKHPDLSDACVTGIPSAVVGNQICAAYSIRNGAKLDQFDLMAYLSSCLAREKLPTKWKQVQNVPRNKMGKLNRRAVKELFND